MTVDDDPSLGEFIEWRSKGIGASDIAGILGISPWQSPYSVWASKVLARNPGDSEGSEPMRWGKLLEDAIISEAARRLNVVPYGYQTRCEHSEFPWARATVDAFCHEPDSENISDIGVIEAKTTGEFYWQAVPEYYECQVLWQLEITGLSYGWLAVLHAGRRLSLWHIPENRSLQASIVKVVREFWERYVLTAVPPMIDGKPGTRDALEAMYREIDGTATVDLDSMRDELRALGRVRRDIKALEADEAALTNKIKAALGPAPVGTLDGREVVTWRAATSRRVDLATLRERYPREAAECETVSETRRFLTKKLPITTEL